MNNNELYFNIYNRVSQKTWSILFCAGEIYNFISFDIPRDEICAYIRQEIYMHMGNFDYEA
jgi:hypothetical protein